jgi:hypothetical protein
VRWAMYHPTARCWRCCARTWAAPAPRKAAARATAAPAPWCWARQRRQLDYKRHQQLHPAGAFGRRHGAVDGGRPGRRGRHAAPRAGGHGAVPRQPVRLLHARLCDEPVWHVPEPCGPRAKSVTRALAQEELSGNLCRCTGYRPILDAAQQMAAAAARRLQLLRKLELLTQLDPHPAPRRIGYYMRPAHLKGLLAARAPTLARRWWPAAPTSACG